MKTSSHAWISSGYLDESLEIVQAALAWSQADQIANDCADRLAHALGDVPREEAMLAFQRACEHEQACDERLRALSRKLARELQS